MIKKVISLATSSFAQLAIRTFTFFYLSYVLTLEEMGYFTFAITLSAIAINIITFGSYNLIMEKAKSEVDMQEFLKNDFCFYTINLSIFLFFYSCIHFLIDIKVPLYISMLFMIGEILQVGLVFVCSSYFLSKSSPQSLNHIRNVNTGIYTVTFLFFVFVTDTSLDSWAFTYIFTSIIFVIYTGWFLQKDFLKGQEAAHAEVKLLNFYFTRLIAGKDYFLSSVVRATFTASDKLMVVMLFGFDKLGAYSLAEKAINAINIPISTFLQLNEPKYYQLNIYEKYKLIINNIPFIILYFAFIFTSYIALGAYIYEMLHLPEKFDYPFELLIVMLFYIVSINIFNALMHLLNGAGKVKLRIRITASAVIIFTIGAYIFSSLYTEFNIQHLAILFVITQIIVSTPFYIRYFVSYASFRKSSK